MLRNVAPMFDKTPGAVIGAGAFFFIGARRIFLKSAAPTVWAPLMSMQRRRRVDSKKIGHFGGALREFGLYACKRT